MNTIKEIFNFYNISGKIKNFAKWSCWISLIVLWIAAVLSSFGLLIMDQEIFCWIPLVGAVVLSGLVWVSSWPMYAFGQLVEDTQVIRQQAVKNGNIGSLFRQPTIADSNEPLTVIIDDGSTKRRAKGRSKDDTLSEKLEYALMFQSDEGMLHCLKDIEDEKIRTILKSPRQSIREQIQNLLNDMQT